MDSRQRTRSPDQLRRGVGYALMGLGMLLALTVLGWAGAYLSTREFSLKAMVQLWQLELGYWAPVVFFLLPATLLFMDGRRLTRPGEVPLWVYGEVTVVLLVLAVAAWAIF